MSSGAENILQENFNIAFVLPNNGSSGGALVVREHAKRLAKLGNVVSIFFENFDAKLANDLWDTPGLDCRTISSITPERTFDLVIATYWKTCFSLSKFSSRHYAYFVQSDERKFFDESLKGFLQCIENTYSWGRHLHYITEAKWIQKLLLDEFGNSAFYAPNGIDCALFVDSGKVIAERLPGGARILVEGPGSVEYKQVARSFEVTNALRKYYPNIEVWYVSSDGYSERSWKYDKAFFRVAHAKMPEIYRSCNFLLKLSTVEGFFGPPLEMMACGGVSVVSNVSGHEEYIRDGKNALVVPCHDTDSAIAAMRSLIESQKLTQALISEGLETARLFDWKDQHRFFAEAVNNIVGSGPKVPLPNLSGVACALDQLESLTLRRTFAQLLSELRQRIKKKIKSILRKNAELSAGKIVHLEAEKKDGLSGTPSRHPKRLEAGRDKILFVGQEEYFRSSWQDAMSLGHLSYSVCSPEKGEFSRLLEYVKEHQIGACIIFRPEWLAQYPEIFSEIQALGIKMIGFSTEPVPRKSFLKFHHPDLLRRFNSLRQAFNVPYDRIIHFDINSKEFLESNFGKGKIDFMPLPVSTKLFHPDSGAHITYDACFLGRSTSHREKFLSPLKEKLNFVHVAHGIRDEAAQELMCKSKCVLNLHNENYPNFENRVIQALMCGKRVISEPLSNIGVDFGEDIVEIRTPEELFSAVQKSLGEHVVNSTEVAAVFSVQHLIDYVGRI